MMIIRPHCASEIIKPRTSPCDGILDFRWRTCVSITVSRSAGGGINTELHHEITILDQSLRKLFGVSPFFSCANGEVENTSTQAIRYLLHSGSRPVCHENDGGPVDRQRLRLKLERFVYRKRRFSHAFASRVRFNRIRNARRSSGNNSSSPDEFVGFFIIARQHRDL